MRITIIFATTFIISSLFTLKFPHQTYATCGTWFPGQPVGQQCVDANTNDAIANAQQCSSNPSACCSPVSECDQLGQDPPPPPAPPSEPPPDPPPGETDPNTDCGTYFPGEIDPQRRCVNAYNDPVYPYAQCSQNPNTCCNSQVTCNEVFGSGNTCIDPPNESPENLGTIAPIFDPNYCQIECLDSSGRSIFPYVNCSVPTPNACARPGLCPTPPPTGLCENALQCDPPVCPQGGSCNSQGQCECFGENQREITPPPPFDLCSITTSEEAKRECKRCLDEKDGIWTGLGCLKFNPEGFVTSFFTLAVGIGGGLGFLRLLQGAFMLTTCAGNPDCLQKAKEVIGGAVAGLLFTIFAAVILNVIGVGILNIPGF